MPAGKTEPASLSNVEMFLFVLLKWQSQLGQPTSACFTPRTCTVLKANNLADTKLAQCKLPNNGFFRESWPVFNSRVRSIFWKLITGTQMHPERRGPGKCLAEPGGSFSALFLAAHQSSSSPGDQEIASCGCQLLCWAAAAALKARHSDCIIPGKKPAPFWKRLKDEVVHSMGSRLPSCPPKESVPTASSSHNASFFPAWENVPDPFPSLFKWWLLPSNLTCF